MSALDDLIARDSGAASGSALDAVIARDAGAPVATPQAAAPSPWDQAMRQIGLTARAGVTGVTSLPTLAGDALNSGINLGIKGVNSLAGSNIPMLQMPSQVVQNSMNAIGVPQPQNGLERGVQDVASSMAGVGPFVGLGNVLAKTQSPVTQAVGRGMAMFPGMQMTGAAGAATGADVARENGAGPTGQMVAGAAGGLAGAVAPSVALAAARGLKGMAGNIAGVVQPIASPQAYVGRQLAQTIGPDAATAAENIRNAAELVPGSLPTTAQAGATPVLVATEKSFANANPDFKLGMAARDAQNNAARWAALNEVAQTPEALAAAQEARSSAASPLYAAAHAQSAPITTGFLDLAKRPAMQSAMQAADSLAKNEGVALQWPTPQNSQISGQAVDYTIRALNDQISMAQRSGSGQQVKALMGIKDGIQNWAQDNIPGLKAATQTYAQSSVPVNTMEAAQQIADQLGTRAMNPTGQPQITAQAFRGAMVKALKEQPYGIDPAGQQTLSNIASDLQRATISGSLKSPGSDTAYNAAANGWLARQLYGQNFGGATGLGRSVGALAATVTGHPYIGLGLLSQGNKLGQLAGNRLNTQLSEMLLNPSLLLPYLEAAQQAPQSMLPSARGNIAQGLLGAAAADRPRP